MPHQAPWALIRSLRTCTPSHNPPIRLLSSTAPACATPLPITARGPPPSPPEPTAASSKYAAVEKKRKQLDMLEQAREIRAAQQPSSKPTYRVAGPGAVEMRAKKSSPLRKRFWEHVHVLRTENAYQVFLDKRPIRTPSKQIISIPLSKPHLAHAIAIEWDLLNSAQEALKNHRIPMTSLVSRAVDIAEADAKASKDREDNEVRESVVKTCLRYLETDTLLCWAPAASPQDSAESQSSSSSVDRYGNPRSRSLREMQVSVATPLIAYLTTHVWPGVNLEPVLDENSIMPKKQDEMTINVIRGWITGLPPFELAALERASLAGKSLCVAARLVSEWSEGLRLQPSKGGDGGEAARFGIEEAAEASSLEVRWQTGMWGEVEDTHDVDKEDVKRQMGSAVLVVSGVKG